MKLRKCHKWKNIFAIFVRCPYCGRWKTFQRKSEINLHLYCGTCERYFELGKQK